MFQFYNNYGKRENPNPFFYQKVSIGSYLDGSEKFKHEKKINKEEIEKAVAIYVPFKDKEDLKVIGRQYNIFVSFDYNCDVFKQKTWFYIAHPDNEGIKKILKKFPRNNNIRKNI